MCNGQNMVVVDPNAGNVPAHIVAQSFRRPTNWLGHLKPGGWAHLVLPPWSWQEERIEEVGLNMS